MKLGLSVVASALAACLFSLPIEGSPTVQTISTRPRIAHYPRTPERGAYINYAPPRNRVCNIKSYNDGLTDDSKYILEALNSCNNGGHAVFQKGLKYTIGTALDLTFLNHIDIGMLSDRDPCDKHLADGS